MSKYCLYTKSFTWLPGVCLWGGGQAAVIVEFNQGTAEGKKICGAFGLPEVYNKLLGVLDVEVQVVADASDQHTECFPCFKKK